MFVSPYPGVDISWPIPLSSFAVILMLTDYPLRERQKTMCNYRQINPVLPQFNDDIKRSSAVIAHNLAFDLPIVTTEFLRCRLETDLP